MAGLSWRNNLPALCQTAKEYCIRQTIIFLTTNQSWIIHCLLFVRTDPLPAAVSSCSSSNSSSWSLNVKPVLPNKRPKVQMFPLLLPPMQTAEPYKLEGMIGFLEGRRKTKRNDGLYKWVLWKQALTDTLLRFSKIEPDEIKWKIIFCYVLDF